MQNLRIQHKLLLLCAGLLAISTVLSMAVVSYFARDNAWKVIDENLLRSYRAFNQTEEHRYRLLDTIANSATNDAALHNVINKTTYSTWRDQLVTMRDEVEEDPKKPQLLLLLTDDKGRTRVRTDFKEPPLKEDLSEVPAIKGALDNNWAHGYWMSRGTFYQVTATAWTKGQYIDGAFLAGWRVDDLLANQIKEITDCQVSFIADRRLVATTLDPAMSGQMLASFGDEQSHLASMAADPTRHDVFEKSPVTLAGANYIGLFHPLQDFDRTVPASLVLDVSLDQQLEVLKTTQLYLIALAAAIILAGILVSTFLSRRLTGPVLALAQAARQLGKGDYGVDIPVRSQDEIGELAVTFDQMRHEIIKREKELEQTARVARDLELAHNIQSNLLPADAPVVDGLDVAGFCCTPYSRVGGDYYDFFQFTEASQQNLDIVIADVFGHDVRAALMMAEGRTALRTAASSEKSPNQILSQTNRTLFADLARTELLISLAYMRIDRQEMKLSYSNAGHNLPFLYRPGSDPQDGTTITLETRGFVLGMLESSDYPQDSLDLREGDILVLYTDGITEAEDRTETQYGVDHLQQVIRRYQDRPAKDILACVLDDVAVFTGQEKFDEKHVKFDDDVTLVVVKVGKCQEAPGPKWVSTRVPGDAVPEPAATDREPPIEISFELPSDVRVLSLLGKVNEAVLEEMKGVAAEEIAPERIEVALSEAVSNAILHGNAGRPNATVKLWFAADVRTGRLTIKVLDRGKGFDINAIPTPVAEDFKEGGRGIFLIRKIMDGIESYTTPEGHFFAMTKSFKLRSPRETLQ